MNYHKISKFDTANGPGIRTTLWVSGCSHACPGCHNACTWDPNSGSEFRYLEVEEILDSLSPDYISGITFSGGDPLYEDNLVTISSIIYIIRTKYPNKSIWLYTGYTYEELDELISTSSYSCYYIHILNNIDVLVEGRFMLDKKDLTLSYCGSTNQRVIDMKKTLESDNITLYIKED